MGAINLSDYPILVELIHNDTPVGSITDDFGTRSVYQIASVHYLNRTGLIWAVIVQDEEGHIYSAPIQPGAEGTVNIPTPQRPVSEPFMYSITFVEA